MEIRLLGKSTWQKVLWLIIISGLIFAALHKWSTVVRVILQLGLLIYVIWMKRGSFFKSLIRMPLLPVTAYVVFVGMTIPISVDPLESAQSWVRLVEMCLIAVTVYHLLDTDDKIRAGLFYILVAFGFAFIMDIEFYLRYLGEKWTWGQIWDTPINFNHHNTYSALCIALVPIAVTILIACRDLWTRIAVSVFLLMDLFLLYILQSRTTQVSLAFVLFITGFFLSTLRRKALYLTIITILVVATVINIRYINPRWLDQTVMTGFGRTENWKNALTLIKERPVLGYGYGRKIYRKVYMEKFGEMVINGHRFLIPHAHSGYLDRMFASGAIGLLLFLVVVVTAFVGLVKRIVSRNEDWIVARAMLLSLAGTFFYFIGDIHDGVQWGLMWVFLAIALRSSRNNTEIKPAPAKI